MHNWETYYHSWSLPFWGLIVLPIVGILFLLLIVWSLYWKARALWLAARKNDIKWFIALLLINTAGILEILYIYRFSKKNKHNHSA